MPWPQTGATQYHAHLGLPDKGRAIKGLVVYNNWDLEPDGLALGCYRINRINYVCLKHGYIDIPPI